MDELIYIIIKLLGEMFGGGKGTPQGPGYPNPMPPSAPPQPARRPTVPQRQGPQRTAPQTRRPGQPAVKLPPPLAMRRQKPPAKAAAPVAPPVPVQAVRHHLTATEVPPRTAPAVKQSARVDAAALRRWLRPQTLNNQFILSEIFQPPLALRDTPGMPGR